jgi:hypothetical protein
MYQKMVLRVDLDEDHASKFQTIKKRMGLRSNTEVIRSMITLRYAEIQPDKAEVEPQEVATR